MDADNDIESSNVQILDQNGVGIERAVLEKKDNIPKELDGIHDKNEPENVERSNDKMIDHTIQKEEEVTSVHMEKSDSATSKKVENKETDHVKAHKQQQKSKNEKPSSAKSVMVPSPKATPNGSLSANTWSKFPVAKNRFLNDHQGIDSNLNKSTKVVPTTSKIHKTKEKLVKPETAFSSDSSALSEGTVEKTRLKPLSKGSSAKAVENEESVESPSASDTKPQRVGKLPSYGFSFKCSERAERRKEFYSKLEEKIHALELERSNQQAKSMESREAEIKMLRKKLTFKATPMPSFYQEPPPPKVELKKVPPTRPRSPKLGRKKNASSSEAERTDDSSHRPARVSLDEKLVNQNSSGKRPSLHSKRPQRKSLPRLPSEKTCLSNTVFEDRSPSQAQDNMANISAPIEPGTENRLLVDDQVTPSSEREGVTVTVQN